MVSQLKVNEIIKQSGSSITIGETGDAINIAGSSYAAAALTPAFSARMSGDQSYSSASNTKVNFDTEDFDTGSAYNTSNQRFTVPSGKAGKYFVHIHTVVDDGTTNSFHSISVYKNGSLSAKIGESSRTFSTAGDFSISCSGVIDLAVGDYIEAYVYLENSTAIIASFSSGRSVSNFTAYRLIGV